MSKSFSLFKPFIYLLCILSFAECTKDDSKSLSNYEGSYYLDSIYWTGEIVDFNGDGNGERDMVHEFSGYPGFVKEWIRGEVKLLDDSKLSFHSVVPVCVICDPMAQPDIKYYDIEIKAKRHDDWGSPDFDTETFEPSIADVHKGVRRAVLYKIQESSYELHVECSLYSQKSGQKKEGNMIFSFKK